MGPDMSTDCLIRSAPLDVRMRIRCFGGKANIANTHCQIFLGPCRHWGTCRNWFSVRSTFEDSIFGAGLSGRDDDVPDHHSRRSTHQAQPERQCCVQASAPLPSYRFTQRPLQGLRDRPYRPDCLPWGSCTEQHAVADRCRRQGEGQMGTQGVSEVKLPQAQP